MNQGNAILLCVATQKGLEVLRAAIGCAAGRRLIACTFKETGVAESFHGKIQDAAAEAGLTTVKWKQFREDPIAFLETYKIGSILCIGWRYLVPDTVVQALDGDVVIAHDSLLPKLRGFAPLVTALISGESEAGVTFLRAGPGIDNGEVLWQRGVRIEPDETIGTLIEKVIPLYREGASLYVQGKLRQRRTQDESKATYSIWRDSEDYRIDWRRDAELIERSVRALGRPYLGTQCVLQGRTVVVHKAEVVPDLDFAIRQPGKIAVLDPQGRPTVICGKGLLKILSATADGKSILPLKTLRARFK